MIALSLAVDHSTFRTCEEVDFCSRLREKEPSENLQVVSGSVSLGISSVTVDLIDLQTADILQLSISAIEGDIFRVRIQEIDFTRYNLPYALDGEPTLAEYVFWIWQNSIF